ncbi:MAG: AI-2E family transporter [Paludibacteraceae bacterium]|nr:AI-2E family transporter [Paludibacteraceae bacterium]
MASSFQKPFTLDRIARLAIYTVVTLGAFLLLKYLSPVLLPFFIAWLLAYIFQPTVDFIQRFLKSRSFSIIVVILGIVLSLLTFLFVMIPTFIEEFVKLKSLLVTDNNLQQSIIPDAWIDYFRQLTDNADVNRWFTPSKIADMVKDMLPELLSLVSNSVDLLFFASGAIFTIIYLFFILRDQDGLTISLIKLVPTKNRVVAISLLRDLRKGMSLYFRRQAFIAVIDASIFALGFWLIDMPMALVMGIMLGAMNMVPYLQYLGLPPAALLMLIQASESGSSIGWALFLLALVFIIVQVVQDFYLIPKIMGKSMGMNPAVVLLSLSIWGYMLGVLGMIIALPLTTILISYYKRFFLRERTKPLFNDNQDSPEQKDKLDMALDSEERDINIELTRDVDAAEAQSV